jgi:predicted PurR-regulated permease PerM
VGTHLVSIFLGVMIAFYLLIDKEKILTIIHKLLEKICTRKLGKELRALAKEADLIFSGYIRGTLMDALVVGTLISISLMLLGLDLALLIGVIAGIFNIIPYFGPLVGMALGGLLGFVSSVPQKGLYAVGIIFLIQQLDSWYIVPKIVGQNVKLPPLLVLLSIVIGGNLFGLIGILLAVPVTAFLKWLILRYGNDWIN